MRNEPLPLQELKDDVTRETALAARRVKTEAKRLEFDAVMAGREAGWSWERLGQALQEPGETLRRRHADRVMNRLLDRELGKTRR